MYVHIQPSHRPRTALAHIANLEFSLANLIFKLSLLSFCSFGGEGGREAFCQLFCFSKLKQLLGINLGMHVTSHIAS